MAITLETSLSITAPVEKVWTAITSPAMVKQYFFGTELDTDWQVGSPIYFRGEWEGKAYEDKGTILAFEPHKILTYSYLSSWGNLPDLPENYANISYAVHQVDDKTILTVTQDGFEDEEKRTHSEQNWQMIFGGMKDLLEKKEAITVEATIDAPIEKVWSFWTEPHHIVHWNQASEDWHTPYAENDLQVGGKFLSRMAAKDGSFSFDFIGTYSKVEMDEIIAYTLEDDRKVSVLFEKRSENQCKIIETFEAENENSLDLQQAGWQAILNSFKDYVEQN